MTKQTISEEVALKAARKFARASSMPYAVWYDEEYGVFRVENYTSLIQDMGKWELEGELLYIVHPDGIIE